MNNPIYNDFTILSVEDYLEKIQAIAKTCSSELFFRGQTQLGDIKDNKLISKWLPSPSIFRDKRSSHEKDYYTYAMTECASEFASCTNHCEILSKMQHYGVPTRLLDITSNALVALFFACVNDDGSVPRKDGVVYVIVSDKAHIKEYDSDTITILSSLPRFTSIAQDDIKTKAEDALASNHPIVDFNKNDNDQVQRLLHEIKKEKPAFEPKINPSHLLDNFIFTPQKTNSRIIKQNGAFILFGLNSQNLSHYNDKNHTSPSILYELKVDEKSKKSITKTLDLCGISLASIYPELYKVAEYLKNSKLKI